MISLVKNVFEVLRRVFMPVDGVVVVAIHNLPIAPQIIMLNDDPQRPLTSTSP